MPANLKNSAVATGLEKISFHSNPKEGQCQRMFKLPHNYNISHAIKVMLKILQASTISEPRTSRYSNWILKGRGSEIKLPTSFGSLKKQENSRITSTSASLIALKPLTVWIMTTVENFLRDWNTSPPYLSPAKSVCRSRNRS